MTETAPSCNGICIMGWELVAGVDPDLVAHAHPECELHSLTTEVVQVRQEAREKYEAFVHQRDTHMGRQLAGLTDQQSCQWLLGVLGEPTGLKPGSFTTPLIEAALAADVRNQRKLAREYPEIMAAVTLWKDHDDGHVIVARIAAGEAV